MKKKFIVSVYFLLFVILIILLKTVFANSFCEFYNICEWGIHLLIVPTVYLLFALFGKTSKSFLMICAVTLGIVIGVLLTRDWTHGFILHKLSATVIGCLIAFLLSKHISN